MITSCDYRVRYVPHPSEEESEETQPSEDNQNAGFRLWSTGPNFDTDLPQDVTGIVGHTAYLTCRVFDRTNSTVSRTGDWTVEISHGAGSERVIKMSQNAQKKDLTENMKLYNPLPPLWTS